MVSNSQSPCIILQITQIYANLAQNQYVAMNYLYHYADIESDKQILLGN